MPDSLIVSSAPGRAGVLGNPSDMYGGTVISIAIDRRAYVAIEPASELKLISIDAAMSQTIDSPQDLAPAPVPSSAELTDMEPRMLESSRRETYLNALKAVVDHQGWTKFQAKISCWSDIPPYAGLSGSSALVAAALHATDRYLGISRNPYDSSETARAIEFHRLGVTCGYQDFYATTFGGFLYMDFRGKERWLGPAHEPLATVERFDSMPRPLPFVIANTGIKRESSTPHRPLRERWLSRESKVVDGVGELAELARKGKKLLLTRAWDEIAVLMNENHRIVRELGGSGEANDGLIEKALGSGCGGAKLAGAGHGGTIICMSQDPHNVVDALKESAGTEGFVLTHAAQGVSREHPEVARIALASCERQGR